jgi:non-canonical purine NTP pyrophosphatase (RdgB/HAM1 family)
MLYYITGNKDKIWAAEKGLNPYNIKFEPRPLELPEIQSESIEEIAQDKARKAFKILQKPLIVNDHGWSIPALKGFPGPYMKYINKWFTSQNFLDLTHDLSDRSIILTDVLCYIDSANIKFFKSEFKGTILREIKGEGLPTMRLVSMTDDNKTVAEYISGEQDPFFNNTNWENFAEWYKHH